MRTSSTEAVRRLLTFSLAFVLALTAAAGGFVRADGKGHLTLDGTPYYYIGTNMWYAAVLASEGQGGDRQRLGRELDALCRLGVRNIRVLVGADGVPTSRKVQPILQPEPGVYNDTLLAGLDYLMVEMARRDMKAVLYLNNSWTWSGGYASYLHWAGETPQEVVDTIAWKDYCATASRFAESEAAQRLFLQHVVYIVGRTNTLTGRPYCDDPTLMAWQVGNEPRAFSSAAKEGFARWVAATAACIKRIDPQHLVSVGSEGQMGCEVDMSLYERLHRDPNIDYLTIHIWPQNWGWVRRAEVAKRSEKALMRTQLEAVYRHTEAYIRVHADLARKTGKPLVIEEFGYPRDGGLFAPKTSTRAKDAYYRFLFDHIVRSSERGDVLAGCNFWGWNGEARTTHLWWQPFDPYMADPAQEEQGLYGVFNSDKTVRVIRRAIRQLTKVH